MKTLTQNEKRGRPDIVHFALLEASGSPLNRERLLSIYVHTINDDVISVNPETRLPRNCNRFISLMEQLFEFKKVPPSNESPKLLSLKKQTLTQLVKEIKPSYILGLSRIGRPRTIEQAASKLANEKRPAVFIGGFAHGHFSKVTAKLANEIVCIDGEMLETWIIVSRTIYEFERALSLPKKRLYQ